MEPSAIEIANSTNKITYYCCVLGCNNNSENNPNSTFHSLPVMNQINKAKNSGDEKIQFLSKQLKICDQHFKQNNVLKVLNNDPTSSYTMSLVMPSVNTKQPVNQQDYHDEGFILGPADIPLAGSSSEEIIEEEVITTEEIDQVENYSVMMNENEFVSVKTEECYDLENVCRVCLSEENLRNIETDYIDDVLLYDMLRTCVKTNSSIEEKLPKRICISCVTDLKTMYDFVLRYKSTKNTLENYITKQQDINERRFYLEHGYINQSVNLNADGFETAPSTSSVYKNSDPEEIKISNSINSLSKELIHNVKGKSNIELDGKTYVLAKAFLCKTCNELLFVKESLDEHKCDSKKKSQVVKHTKTNLIIKQTDINRCNLCGRKFSNLVNHICDNIHKATVDFDNAPTQKCPKCKIIFKYYHKCEQDPHSMNKKMPLLLVKQNKKRKVVSTL